MTDSTSLSASTLFGVKGLVAVITGGGSGIGLMMAKALALNGASKVYILGRTLSKLQTAASTSPHNNIIPIQTDITSKDSLAAAASQIQQESGHINLLICNAGIVAAGFGPMPANPDLSTFQSTCWNLEASDFARVYETNLTAVFFTTIAFLHLLDAGKKAGNYPAEQGVSISSQVIITSSVAGLLKKPPSFAYASSKAGVIHMAKNLGAYLSSYEIRVNVIAPGVYPTELSQGIAGRFPDGKVPRGMVPEGRWGTEEDMAGTLLYLASRAGAYTDGCVVVTDGGMQKIQA